MQSLLDTHIFLWYISGDIQLSTSCRDSIQNPNSLTVNEASVARFIQLPPLHRDPFDRLLICQALEHNLTIVTTDIAVMTYPMAQFLK
jgi:PIN domain nuclease of toxin-antitoxin system